MAGAEILEFGGRGYYSPIVVFELYLGSMEK